MSQRIKRSIREPLRKELSWGERWEGNDKGLITCWEVGRRMRENDKELAKQAEGGELPVLGWKGGVERKIKKDSKVGTLFYLAQLQGLKGEDLDIDLSEESELVCSRTDIKVIYTGDVKKYSSA